MNRVSMEPLVLPSTLLDAAWLLLQARQQPQTLLPTACQAQAQRMMQALQSCKQRGA